MEHIYPIFDKMLTRADKEALLGQRGIMIWMTGLSGSGKRRGILCRILDGDNIRSGINNNLGFSPADRRENIRRIAEVARLFVDTGIVTIAAFISPSEELRRMAAGIVGEADFFEIYVNTPLSVCEQRDVKGLYAKARRGEIREFTGISAPFEAPAAPAMTVDTSAMPLADSVKEILNSILPRINKQN